MLEKLQLSKLYRNLFNNAEQKNTDPKLVQTSQMALAISNLAAARKLITSGQEGFVKQKDPDLFGILTAIDQTNLSDTIDENVSDDDRLRHTKLSRFETTMSASLALEQTNSALDHNNIVGREFGRALKLDLSEISKLAPDEIYRIATLTQEEIEKSTKKGMLFSQYVRNNGMGAFKKAVASFQEAEASNTVSQTTVPNTDVAIPVSPTAEASTKVDPTTVVESRDVAIQVADTAKQPGHRGTF